MAGSIKGTGEQPGRLQSEVGEDMGLGDDLDAESTVVDAAVTPSGLGSQEAQGGSDEDPSLLLAEFESPDTCMRAAEAVRDAGYEHWDVYTPYPVHGMDDAMGLKPTRLGWISFACGLTGVLGAVLMIQWMNAVDYPLIVGGKPGDAYPSMIPIMFECMVLLTGFGTFFGMLALNRLPRHHHPVFESKRFELCSDDRFFIAIETRDANFDQDETPALLESSNAVYLEWVREGGENASS